MDVVAIHSASQPDKTALVEGDRALTWGQYGERRARLANALLGLGVAPGERLAVWAPNSIEYLLAGAAAGAIGCVSVPVNHRLTAGEAGYVLGDSDAVAIFVGDDYLPTAEEVRATGGAPGVRHWILVGQERRPDALHIDDLISSGDPTPPAVTLERSGLGGSMIYTAGTTGKPKGALRSDVDPSIALGWLRALDLAEPNDVHLVAGPLYHAAPGAFALLTQVMGGSCVIMRKFNAEEALRLIESRRCTTTFMAPILLKRILDLPKERRARYDVSSMRVVIVGGAPCPNAVKEETLDYFGPVLYEFYGSSELGINTILRPEDMLRKPGSCGRAAPGIELAILDDEGNPVPTGQPGELHVRRYQGMFEHYHKKPEATAEATRGEWVSVGDVAYLDDEGFVYICDRKRDMIISGGVNIYPAEIEDALHRHPALADVAVFGVPDEEWGERVHAAVLLRPGQEAEPEEIKRFARQHLADYKVPREVSFHDDFPRDSAGKMVKRLLRDPYWAGRDQKV
jgi:acyl-CoA synthetase (AMP-forming)/AMP-acid ligase II